MYFQKFMNFEALHWDLHNVGTIPKFSKEHLLGLKMIFMNPTTK